MECLTDHWSSIQDSLEISEIGRCADGGLEGVTPIHHPFLGDSRRSSVQIGDTTA